MSDASTETKTAQKFDPEAFAMNLARAMESGGQALAAYLKPREQGEPRDKPPNELGEMIKTFSTVAEYWLSDKTRATELQMKLGKSYLDLWGSSMRRLAGEQVSPAIEPSPRDKRFTDPEWRSNQFFDFIMQLYLLTTQWAGAVEFCSHQSGGPAHDARLERRQSRSRHEDADGGYRSRARHVAHPAIRPFQSRCRGQHGDDAGQGDFPE
jgi:hypothetical protein